MSGPRMTLLLALDCSAGACSVAVADGGKSRAFEHLDLARGHAEVLMPMIERVLNEAGCTARDLDAVAATVGPGSFTGLRIGLAAARGLALAVGARTIPVTSLEAIARAAGDSGLPLLVGLDTKRGDFYVQWFDPSGRSMGEPTIMEAVNAVRAAPHRMFRVAGDGADPLAAAAMAEDRRADVVASCRVPDARFVAALADMRLATGGEGPLRPLYLRAPAVNPPPP